MEQLADLGLFLGGFGFFLVGCGCMWWISLYAKSRE